MPPTQRQVHDALARHREFWNALDESSWLANLVDEPYLEEPVGVAIVRGRQYFARAIRAAIEGAPQGRSTTLHDPVTEIVNGDRAAVYFTTTRVADGVTTTIEAIEEFQVAADGRIAGIRAFLPAYAIATLTR
jgi:hypothetical protein